MYSFFDPSITINDWITLISLLIAFIVFVSISPVIYEDLTRKKKKRTAPVGVARPDRSSILAKRNWQAAEAPFDPPAGYRPTTKGTGAIPLRPQCPLSPQRRKSC
jgi:hypothetical protein